jgi:hypothetical protein
MTESLGRDAYAHTLTEIGRITTTWAKFEHWIDQALRALAIVHDREWAWLSTKVLHDC